MWVLEKAIRKMFLWRVSGHALKSSPVESVETEYISGMDSIILRL